MNAPNLVSAIADTSTAYTELNADADTGVMLATEGFRLLARSLSLIRAGALYREAGYTSFRAYMNAKTEQWQTAHDKSIGYKHATNIINSHEWLETLQSEGLTLDADSEYEVRQARKLAKEIDLSNDAAALVTLTHKLLPQVDKTTVKAWTAVVREAIDTGAITLFSGAQVALEHAADSEAFESSQRALEHAKNASMKEWEISAQLDLALGHYALFRSEFSDTWYVSLIWQGHYVISYDRGNSTYDALLSALATLYQECEGL